ncbi:hypothetical protein HU200_005343 [Digitaria exilis]|uniref:Uncharacterized protein n=1 Tax=Digitaria exilis TaxID=1010633 RepID=A0A835KWQ0_9POAL|nr:hypothetical protein HU200_005343 [Digitaria exilis]
MVPGILRLDATRRTKPPPPLSANDPHWWQHRDGQNTAVWVMPDSPAGVGTDVPTSAWVPLRVRVALSCSCTAGSHTRNVASPPPPPPQKPKIARRNRSRRGRRRGSFWLRDQSIPEADTIVALVPVHSRGATCPVPTQQVGLSSVDSRHPAQATRLTIIGFLRLHTLSHTLSQTPRLELEIIGATMKVDVVETTMVAPSEDTPRRELWLSNLDLAVPKKHTPLLYYYPAPAASGGDAIATGGTEEAFFAQAERLKAALAKALVPFYPLAGRLGVGEGDRLQIDCNAEGALFAVARADFAGDDVFLDYQPSPEIRRMFVPSGDPPCCEGQRPPSCQPSL